MSEAEGSEGVRDARAFFGRRKGKGLRAAQGERIASVLPRLRIDLPTTGSLDPRSLFPRPVEDVWLEIGFGGGEHLAAQARANPGVGFIGCEPFVNGMAKLLRAIEDDGLDAVRLWDSDATELLPRLPPASIGRAFLLYPDPWPKRRQRKRRFVSDATLAEISRVLRPGGMLRVASDIDDYAGWTLAHAARQPHLRWTAETVRDWTVAWPDWPGTRYEAKAKAAGRQPTYLSFERV